MIKNIVRDVMFLSRKSEPAERSSVADAQTARDLQDTLRAHSEECVGMAANMIGVNKNIIIVNVGLINMVMFNPVITQKSGSYMTEEGCLSLTGTRPVERFENITVEYQDMAWKKQKKQFSGWTAQIIQHEVDHLSGKII